MATFYSVERKEKSDRLKGLEEGRAIMKAREAEEEARRLKEKEET